jgi:hypothetical protein
MLSPFYKHQNRIFSSKVNTDAENIAPENVNKLLDLLPTEDEVRMFTDL